MSRETPASEDFALASLAAKGRCNAFDAFRLILALAVVYSHACLLGGFGAEGFLRFSRLQSAAGTLGVMGFFGISGFLVTRSLALSGSARQFVKSRFLRIVPGFYFALLVTAFVLAPLIGRFNPRSGGWSAGAALRFFTDNALIHITDWHIGGVLNGLPYGESVNGALWSLFPEVCCYAFILSVGLLGLLRSGRENILLAAALALAFNAAIFLEPQAVSAAPSFLRLTLWAPFVAAFAVGSALFCYGDRIRGGARPAFFWAAAALVLLRFGGWPIAGPLVLTMALIQAAFIYRVSLPCDLSYGTYLLHFPVLQMLAALGMNRLGFAAYLASALLITLPLAGLSWFAVERPFLRLKRRAAPATA